MSPNSFHDIVPPERRSIRNVTPSHPKTRLSRPYEGEGPEEAAAPPRPPRRRRGRRRLTFFIVALVLLAAAIVGFSWLFAGSKIVVTPKQKDVAVEGSFQAQAEESNGMGLTYQVMTHSKSISTPVPASGEEYVETPASGTIVIYNDYSEAEQRLVKNTRFETGDGLVYRIAESVTVPGQTTRDGETVPGSVEAVVYADQPGEQYNIGLTDFTIPGFEGDPRYDSFYARSKTPMQGGFVGNRPAVEETTLGTATSDLEEQLAAQLRAEARAQIPEGFYLFDDMTFVTYDPASLAPSGEEVQLTLNGTLQGVLFAKDAFARFIASETVAGYEGEPVVIEDISTLKVTPVSADGLTDESGALPFTAAGTARLIWTFSQEGLKGDLSGRDKEALPTVLSGYPSIERAEVVLRPFWRQTFPENPDEIAVEIEVLE